MTDPDHTNSSSFSDPTSGATASACAPLTELPTKTKWIVSILVAVTVLAAVLGGVLSAGDNPTLSDADGNTTSDQSSAGASSADGSLLGGEEGGDPALNTSTISDAIESHSKWLT